MSDAMMLTEAAGRLFADLLDDGPLDSPEWAQRAWTAIAEMGLPLALVPEEAGGFGLATADALTLARLAGSHALPLPLVETMLANRLLAEAGLPLAEGMASVMGTDGNRVPWGRAAMVIAAETSEGTLVRVEGAAVRREGTNLALAPRDAMAAPAAGLPQARREGHPLLLWGAALRTLQMAGALETVLALTITHTTERQQFGKPLSKFQAVQHDIARLGSEAAAASAAADMAAEAIAGTGDASLPVAAARVRVGEAVGVAVGIAQQLHGAIGFTREHRLHRYTTALLSWRDEFGGHSYWTQMLGKAALAAGGRGFWQFVTEAA